MSGFLQTLRNSTRRRIPLNELRRLWLATHQEQIQHPERDRLLLDELRNLAGREELTLPSPRNFEPGNPPMPRFVQLIGKTRPARDDDHWEKLAWRPELGFWTELSARERETAEKINMWLTRRRGTMRCVPLRERSLEIFHDEKYLDRRVQGNSLFNGRLPLEAIGAFVVPHPLPYRAIGAPGNPVLVVENHHTYWSLAEWNQRSRCFAAVAYGEGNALCSAASALREVLRECHASGAVYFGDLDPEGIRIPLRFNAMSTPKLHPAIPMYRFLLEHGTRRTPVTRGEIAEQTIREWMPDLAEDILALWAGDQWIPQEALGTEQLAEGALPL